MDLRRISTPHSRQDKMAVLSIEEVKAQARVTDDSENDLIADYIEAAYDFLSGPNGWLNGYCFLPETYEFYAAGVGSEGFELPLRPLIQTTPPTIEARNTDGTYAAVSTDLYYVVVSDVGYPLVRRAPLQLWPGDTSTYHPLTYRMTITAGHEDPLTIPSPIRQGMKLLAAHWYANREAAGPAGKAAGADIPYGLRNLCGRYRMAHDHS